MYASVNDPKVTRAEKKPPGFICEAACLSILLFIAKLYSDAMFEAISFVIVLSPMMLYFTLAIVLYIFKFVTVLHMEDSDDDEGFLTPRASKVVFNCIRNLAGFFGVYLISGELDKHIQQKELATVDLTQGLAAVSVAMMI